MKKRFFSLLLTLCMVLSFMPTSAFAEVETEEPPLCVCETACTAESMNTACSVCGEDGALPKICGQYVPADDGHTDSLDAAPTEGNSDAGGQPVVAAVEDGGEEQTTCTCEAACTAESMNAACSVCGEDGALPESCGQYIPAEDGQTDEPDNDPAEEDSDAVVQTNGAAAVTLTLLLPDGLSAEGMEPVDE